MSESISQTSAFRITLGLVQFMVLGTTQVRIVNFSWGVVLLHSEFDLFQPFFLKNKFFLM